MTTVVLDDKTRDYDYDALSRTVLQRFTSASSHVGQSSMRYGADGLMDRVVHGIAGAAPFDLAYDYTHTDLTPALQPV